MLFEDVLRNSPVLKKALEAGEEQVGRVVGKLLASDLTGGLQGLVSTAIAARRTFEKGVSQALHAANLPSRDDVAALKRRLEELEAMLDGLAEKVGPAGPGRAGRGPGGDGAGEDGA